MTWYLKCIGMSALVAVLFIAFISLIILSCFIWDDVKDNIKSKDYVIAFCNAVSSVICMILGYVSVYGAVFLMETFV